MAADHDVISAAGRRDTRLVGGLRVASAACTAGALVALSRVFAGGSTGAALTAVCFAVLAGAFAFGELSYGGRAARAEERRVRTTLLRRQFALASRVERQEEQRAPASVIQLMTDNAERLTEYRQVYFGATLAALAIPFLTLAYVGIGIDWVVGFGVMLLVPLIPLLIRGFMLLFRKSSAESRRQRALLSRRYLDAIRNLVTIRLLGAGERVERELSAQGEANRGAIMRLLAGNQIVIIVMDGLFALLLICATAGLTVLRADHLDLAETLAIMLLTVLLLEPLQQVAGFFYIGMGGRAAQKAIAAHLARTSDSTPSDRAPEPDPSGHPDAESRPSDAARPTAGAASAPGAEPSRPPAASDASPAGDGLALELTGVHADYGRGEVLSGIDLHVAAGSRVAIVGRSGAGKSTLLALLRGALPARQGHIRIGGQALDPHDPAATRALSATVAQSTWLFTGTIADNLRLVRPDATEPQMWQALTLAHVAEEITRMPRGLDTHLGEGAALISGGQAQRISLARALLSGRRVLLLDEPTSQVDVESEARIIDAIAGLPRDWTILMVTHRPSLLQVADTVYELREGRLHALEGSHA